MAAAFAHDALMPPRPGGTLPGALLSLLAHAGLVAALAYGVSWRAPATETVSAELWAALPQAAAPPAVSAPPPAPAPPAPRPAPVEKTAPPVTLPDPQIAIEKARKENAAKAERAEKARLEKDERDKTAIDKQRLAKEKTLADQKAQAAEDARLAKLREDNLRRMMGQLGPASSPTAATGSGTAAANAGPSASYGGRLIGAIKPNIKFADISSGNPVAVVEVTATASGSVIGATVVKPSGVKEWDEAVLRAIYLTATLPRDTDGRVPTKLTITFRPRD